MPSSALALIRHANIRVDPFVNNEERIVAHIIDPPISAHRRTLGDLVVDAGP